MMNLPSTCEIDLTGCSLSDAVLNRLREITQQPNYQGPRISFSIVEQTEQENKSIEELLNELYALAQLPKNELTALLDYENQVDVKSLQPWLSRLSWTADFKKGGDKQKDFAKRVVSYLKLANDDPKFRDSFFASLMGASETCGDRVALSVLYIDLNYQLSQFDLKDMKGLSHLLSRGTWTLEMLQEIARNKVSALPFFDEIEVYLSYPIKLKEALQIPLKVEDMLYFRCSGVTENDLDEAEKFVLEKLNDRKALLDFLNKQDVWQKALHLNYEDRMSQIEAEKQRKTEEVTESGDYSGYEEIEVGYHKQVDELNNEILDT